ncbi:MAG: hypothetical protein WD749_05015 [Phycisphaerales bacterium]
MRCLRCNYPLLDLATTLCPECGRPFDPADPETWDDGDTRKLRAHIRFRRALLILTGLAVLHVALGWACWGLAAATLGHAPVPQVDDPGSLPVVAAIRSGAWAPTGLLVGWAVPVALVCMAALLTEPGPREERRRSRRIVGWSLAVWMTAVAGFCVSSGVWVWLAG